MNIEQGAFNFAVGLGTSFINGAYDKQKINEGLGGIADVVTTITVWTGACTLAGLYLEMPVYIPVALSVLVRGSSELRRAYEKAASMLKKE